MSKLRSLKRHLNERNVWIAKEVEKKKVELAKKFVEERAKKDAEFAKDLLKAVGDNLPPETKKVAEESVAKEAIPKNLIVSNVGV
jgi:hypothetical protein